MSIFEALKFENMELSRTNSVSHEELQDIAMNDPLEMMDLFEPLSTEVADNLKRLPANEQIRYYSQYLQNEIFDFARTPRIINDSNSVNQQELHDIAMNDLLDMMTPFEFSGQTEAHNFYSMPANNEQIRYYRQYLQKETFDFECLHASRSKCPNFSSVETVINDVSTLRSRQSSFSNIIQDAYRHDCKLERKVQEFEQEKLNYEKLRRLGSPGRNGLKSKSIEQLTSSKLPQSYNCASKMNVSNESYSERTDVQVILSEFLSDSLSDLLDIDFTDKFHMTTRKTKKQFYCERKHCDSSMCNLSVQYIPATNNATYTQVNTLNSHCQAYTDITLNSNCMYKTSETFSLPPTSPSPSPSPSMSYSDILAEIYSTAESMSTPTTNCELFNKRNNLGMRHLSSSLINPMWGQNSSHIKIKNTMHSESVTSSNPSLSDCSDFSGVSPKSRASINFSDTLSVSYIHGSTVYPIKTAEFKAIVASIKQKQETEKSNLSQLIIPPQMKKIEIDELSLESEEKSINNAFNETESFCSLSSISDCSKDTFSVSHTKHDHLKPSKLKPHQDFMIRRILQIEHNYAKIGFSKSNRFQDETMM